MSINNINSNSGIDALIHQNIEAFAKSGTPQGPSQGPMGGAPEGVTLRNSGSNDMAPQQRNLPGQPPMVDPQTFMNLFPGSTSAPTGVYPPPMPPSQPPGSPNLSAVSQQGGNDAVSQAKADAQDSMKTMAEMNAINMQFQTQMSVMQMQKGMNEAVAKTIKEIGTKVAQLAG